MDKIYVFETRQLNYLDAYIAKAKTLHYNPVVISSNNLHDERLAEFKKYYQHLGVNDYAFEFNCFARYFALANEVVNNDPFILSDSDIYIVDRNISLSEQPKGTFIGSDGFYKGVSECQISPHFSFWDKELVNDFVDYLISAYKRNQEDQFLVKYYEMQKSRLGNTAISDMTLLYLWINDNKIPFINSNSTDNEWGIDHNISLTNCENARYQTAYGRKKIEITPSGGINFILETGERQAMSCLHFQGDGSYKPILYDFYLGNYKKFEEYSAKVSFNNKLHQLANGQKVKLFKKMAGDFVIVENALDAYLDIVNLISDDRFRETPPRGGLSYAEEYAHILQATLTSAIEIEKNADKITTQTDKKLNVFGKLVIFIERLWHLKQPKLTAGTQPVKITKHEARKLISECKQKIGEVVNKIDLKKEGGRIGLLNNEQWLALIGIHLKYHLKQLNLHID